MLLTWDFRVFKVTLGRSTYDECNALFHQKPHYTFPLYYILEVS